MRWSQFLNPVQLVSSVDFKEPALIEISGRAVTSTLDCEALEYANTEVLAAVPGLEGAVGRVQVIVTPIQRTAEQLGAAFRSDVPPALALPIGPVKTAECDDCGLGALVADRKTGRRRRGA